MLKQDFALGSNGDIVIVDNNIQLIEGRDIYVQAFRQILRTRLGEYFLNVNEGLDYNVFLGQKKIDTDLAYDALQKAGLQVDDFVKFTEITFEYNDVTRVLKVGFTVLFQDGYRERLYEEVGING